MCGRDALGTISCATGASVSGVARLMTRRARPFRRRDRRSLEYEVAMGRHLGSRSDRRRERPRAGGADGRWHRDDSSRDDCTRRTARARCRSHDEARSGASRRRRSGRAAPCRGGLEPRPRRRAGDAVARFAGPCLPTRRANAKTTYPIWVSRRVIHRMSRSGLHRRRRRPTEPECLYDELVDGGQPRRDLRDSRRRAGRRFRLPGLAAHRPHSAPLAGTRCAQRPRISSVG